MRAASGGCGGGVKIQINQNLPTRAPLFGEREPENWEAFSVLVFFCFFFPSKPFPCSNGYSMALWVFLLRLIGTAIAIDTTLSHPHAIQLLLAGGIAFTQGTRHQAPDLPHANAC